MSEYITNLCKQQVRHLNTIRGLTNTCADKRQSADTSK